jgi:hypothetical protein
MNSLRILALAAASAVFAGSGIPGAEDCNGNGTDDRLDLIPGEPSFSLDDGGGLRTDQEPALILAGDLDGDGDADLIAGFEEESGDRVWSTFEVFPNGGGGRFEPDGTISFEGAIPAGLLEDFDLDGLLDLAAPNPVRLSPRIQVFFTRGDGTLADPIGISIGVVSWSLAASDLDADGLPDLATESRAIFNRGGRSFEDVRILPIDGTPREVSAGDLDGDGDGDVAVIASHSLDLTILQNGGDRDFVAASTLSMNSYGIPTSLRFLDIDGDGDRDIAAHAIVFERPDPLEDSRIAVFVNTGQGTFGEPLGRSFPGRSPAPVALEVPGELPRLATVAEEDDASLLVFPGRPDGSLGDPAAYEVRCSIVGLAAADLDGDAGLDLATLHGDGRIALHLGREDGTFAIEPFPDTPRGRGPCLVLGPDLDGDGDRDLALAGSEEVSLFMNRGDGTFLPGGDVPVGQGAMAIAGADFDHDGAVDLAVADLFPASVSLLRNEGSGAFGEAKDYPLARQPYSLAAADLDGDGFPDLSIAIVDGLSFYWNRGDGDLEEGTSIPFRLHYNPFSVVPADFDGDGAIDLAAAGHSPAVQDPGLVRILRNAGDGRFEPPVDLEVAPQAYRLAAADLDGDGRPDLAVTALPSVLSILRNGGGGAFEPPRNEISPGSCSAIAPADIDGDGDQDLMLTTGSLAILANAGSGTFPAARIFPAPGAILGSLAAADFDGDGWVDAAATNPYDGPGTVFLFRNSTPRPASLDLDRNGIPDECEEARFRRGDPDGNGGVDISDAIRTLGYLFIGGSPVACPDAADANDDGGVDLSDAIAILQYAFQGGPPPPEPGPTACGPDGTADRLGSCAYEQARC